MNKWVVAGMTLTLTIGAHEVRAQRSTTDKDDHSTITVTGCLQQGTAGSNAVGTSGATANDASGPSGRGATNGPFMLMNARVGGAPGGGSGVTTVAPAGSGTTDSAARAGSTQPSPALSGAITRNGEPDRSESKTYQLRGDLPELPRHVGQEVEISGRLMDSGTGSATTGDRSGAAARPDGGAPSAATRPQELEARTIRMIASACAAR